MRLSQSVHSNGCKARAVVKYFIAISRHRGWEVDILQRRNVAESISAYLTDAVRHLDILHFLVSTESIIAYRGHIVGEYRRRIGRIVCRRFIRRNYNERILSIVEYHAVVSRIVSVQPANCELRYLSVEECRWLNQCTRLRYCHLCHRLLCAIGLGEGLVAYLRDAVCGVIYLNGVQCGAVIECHTLDSCRTLYCHVGEILTSLEGTATDTFYARFAHRER